MQECDFNLVADLVSDCKKPSQSGIQSKAYVMNYDEIDHDGIVRDTTNPNIVKTLQLKDGTGIRAYAAVMPGGTPFTGTNKALATGTYRNNWTKTLSMVLLNNGAGVAANVIDKLANGRFVVVVENKFKGTGADNQFEIYGLEQGLVASEITDDKYSEDTDGGWAITLVENDAPTSGIFLLNTDAATTRAALESLLEA